MDVIKVSVLRKKEKKCYTYFVPAIFPDGSDDPNAITNLNSFAKQGFGVTFGLLWGLC